MNLYESLEANKKLTHNSPLRKELYERLKNYKFYSYQEAVYIYMNDLKDIPRCKYSNNNQYFNGKKYVGSSKEYFNYLKYDNYLKSKWLSWEHLFDIGLTLQQASILKQSKKLQYVRLIFSFIKYSRKKIKTILIERGFLENKIDEILNFDYYNIYDLLLFIDNINLLFREKNNKLEYYINRGYDKKTAEKELYNQFNTWKKFNKNVDKNSIRYKNWLKSRKIGLSKSTSSLRSKFEKQIYEELKNEFDINIKFYTKINHELFSKTKFLHDFLINEKLIIEYNGGYWHNDVFTNKKWGNLSKYKLEIIKAHICIKENNKKYLILWENDIGQNINKVKALINIALSSEDKFFSSRDIDIEFYKELN